MNASRLTCTILMNASRLTCTILGTAVFAVLTTIALDSSWRVAVAILSAVIGYLSARLFRAFLVLGTGANPRKPEAMDHVRIVALISAAFVVVALALFMWLRFAVNDAAASLFSVVAVLFEIGVFLLSGAAECAYLIRA
jgi:hypothetical protein